MSSNAESWTVRRILEWTGAFLAKKEVDNPRLSSELLLAHVLKLTRIKLYTDYDRPLVDAELTVYRELIKRAADHEPIAYLTGVAHFFDLELEIARPVLIPRPDTETLVESALRFCRQTAGFENPRVLDLCTGSGCIALAIAKHLKGATVVGVDVDDAAVTLAKRNVQKLGMADRVTIVKGDLFSALAEAEPFHLIVSNPPYIPSGDIAGLDRSVKDFESHRALDGGADGLDFHRKILGQAAGRLLPGGRVYLEIQFDQGPRALELVTDQTGLKGAQVLKDAANHDRVLACGRE